VKYMIDIAMGMHYLSEKGLVHRVSSFVCVLQVSQLVSLSVCQLKSLIVCVFWIIASPNTMTHILGIVMSFR